VARREKDGVRPAPRGDGGVDVDLDPLWVVAVRRRLVDWYDGARRDLPWRADADPYRILVSEMMLVQTTVAVVIPYYERFLRSFPTVGALAGADEDEVLKAWEGLGYYRRARQLHTAARAVVECHGGVFPDDPEAIRALPGVGPYIAGALLSFAFDQPAPILEANTQRVVARWLAWKGDLKASATQSRLWEAAGRLVPPTGAGRFNQAFMELGALVCTPRAPRCLVCPVARECQARALGLQDELPATTPRPPALEVEEACALVSRDGRLLVLKRGSGRLWEDFWEFPTVHLSGADPAVRSVEQGGAVDLASGVFRLTGVEIDIAPAPALTVRYGVTRHRVRLDAFEATATAASDALAPAAGFREAAWVAPERLAALPFSSAGRRLVAWVSRHGLEAPPLPG
jgi:A/G-specific adenine glycosylase